MTNDFNTYFKTRANTKTLNSTDMLVKAIYKALRSKADDKVALAQILVDATFKAPKSAQRYREGWGYTQALTRLYRQNIKWTRESGTEFHAPFTENADEAAAFYSILQQLKAPDFA